MRHNIHWAITAERRRQVKGLGYTPEHDAEHTAFDLLIAAAAYGASASGNRHLGLFLWPWERSGFKPRRTDRDLVRAGALALAAVERITAELDKR